MPDASLFTKLTQTTFWGNQVWQAGALFLAVLGALLAGKILQYLFARAAKRFHEQGKETRAVAFRGLARSVLFLAFALSVKYGVLFLAMPENVAGLVGAVASVLLTLAVGWVLYCLVDVVDTRFNKFATRTESKLDDMLVPIVRKSLRVTLVILVLVQVATLLSDKPLTSVIAGLGVGGLAIALAAQETLKNFFGSIAILADKPFELGDRIVIDGHDGPVEEVGFRSTKIRTLDGHLVTIPNSELANKTVQNVGKRPYIRRILNITITYDTPPEKVQRAVAIVKELLADHEGMRPDFPPRVYFNDFNSASLNILAIYWYHPPNYWDFMAFTERFNGELLRRFGEEEIEFAFPTQTLYLAGDEKRPLVLPRDA